MPHEPEKSAMKPPSSGAADEFERRSGVKPSGGSRSAPVGLAGRFAGSIYSVREFSREVRFLLEAHFDTLAVQGEVTNLSRPHSGHIYFSLVDDEPGSTASRFSAPQVPVVMWRSTASRQRFEITSGMKVIVVGRVGTYEPRGSYQVVASRVFPAGVGELQVAFDALKAKLASEGLFDPARKRPLPFLPRAIGVVTSPSGAAVRDFLRVVYDRYPRAWVRIAPARVQGEGAADEIARALASFDEDPGPVDVIVLARGGGSIEDLWAFNEESVARAIARAARPVVSAVGHEVDVTIADFVADARAPTPTRAAELVVPDRQDLLERLRIGGRGVARGLERLFEARRRAVDSAATTGCLREPQVYFRKRLEEVRGQVEALEIHLYKRWERWNDAVRVQAARLDSLSPLAVLTRGYAVVSTVDGKTVRRAAELAVGERVALRFRDGRVAAQVTDRDGPRAAAGSSRDGSESPRKSASRRWKRGGEKEAR